MSRTAVEWEDVISRGDLWLVVLAVLLPVAVFRLTPVTEYGRGFDSDGAYYAAMAGAPGVPPELASRAPYCHRVLTPAVVARMSGDVLGRFRRLALWSSILNLLLVGVLVRRCGEGPLAAALAVLLYAGVFWTVKFPAYSPAYVDFQTQTFLLLVALLAPIARARWWLIPVFVLGVLQKESLLAFAPFAIFASLRKRRPFAAALAWAALLVVLPLGALLAVRLAVSQTNAYQPTDVLDYLGRLAQPGYGIRLIHAGISGLGLLPFVILLQPGAAWRALRARPESGVWLGVAFVLLFGGMDKERLLLYALPALVALAATVSNGLSRAMPRSLFIAWAAVTLGVHAWLGQHLEPMPSYLDYLDRLVPIHGSPRHRAYLRRDLIGIASWGLATAVLLLPVLLRKRRTDPA